MEIQGWLCSSVSNAYNTADCGGLTAIKTGTIVRMNGTHTNDIVTYSCDGNVLVHEHTTPGRQGDFHETIANIHFSALGCLNLMF